MGSDSILDDGDLALIVNGEPQLVGTGSTVDSLLQNLGLERRRIAVAVNRDVVPRSHFASHRLLAGDCVEILEAVGGG
jgi:sulfur carrier protein